MSTLELTRLQHRVVEIEHLSNKTYVLKLEKGTIDFIPGQCVSVGPLNDINMREYSINSPITENTLDLLIKEVDEGYVSKKLRTLLPGSKVQLEGPFGFFLLEEWMKEFPLYFIATGTGISPFRSITGSTTGLNYTLLHGVRTLDERYQMEEFEKNRYISCVTGEKGGDYPGRVTDYLKEHEIPRNGLFFLCGNCDMIYDVYDILKQKEIPLNRIFAEVYF